MQNELPDAIYPITKDDLDKLDKKVSSDFYNNKYGNKTAWYGYRNDDSEIMFMSVEFERGTYVWYNSTEGWIKSFPPNIRNINLFNSTVIPEECKKVFIVNTEKEARTAIKGWHGVSWCGGYYKKITYSNWKKLLNIENIIIWADEKSAMKIKTRLPHAKIITHGNFIDCKSPLKVFNDTLKLNELSVPAIDPFEFYELFIHEFYGDESLEQRSGVFWGYRNSDHHWRQEHMENIKANFQAWFINKRKDIGASLLDYVRAEGHSVNKFINNTLEYIRRHTAGMFFDSPFKDSAISPYIHLQNGMIHLSKKGKMAEWIERTEETEDFFRKKYPVHCCDYDFNEKHLKAVNIDDAPCFKYVIDNFIPKDEKLSDNQRKKTYEFFSQIIAYSISPIKPSEYFFGLYGNEGTGKTFFTDILKDIVGDNFFLERPIDEMTQNNRFASSDFWGSKVYVEPDMKTNSLLPESFIKTFAGQKQITVEKKHNQPERGVNISISMFFVSNFDFITKGMEGLARRVIYIPFKNAIANPDRSLRDKIKGNDKKGKEAGSDSGKIFDERPIILALAMQGWKTFLKNGSEFTTPKWISDAKTEWIEKSDTVRGFLKEEYLQYKKYNTAGRVALYNEYVEFCKDTLDKKPYGKTKFYEEMGRTKEVVAKKIKGYDSFEFFSELKPSEPFSE